MEEYGVEFKRRTAMTTDKESQSKSRLIFINDINEKKGREAIQKIFELNEENSSKDIVLVLSSCGGDVYEFMGIHDAMRLVECDVATLAIGKAMSCGLFLLMSGAKGKRFVTQNTTLLTHGMGVSADGQIVEVKTEVAEYDRLQGIIRDLFLEYTKVKKANISNFIGKDTYLSASKAVRLGIADHLVKSPQIWKHLDL